MAAVGALLLLVGMLAFDDAQPDLGWIALTLATAALVLAGTAAVLLPAGPGPAGMLPGARPALNVVWGVSLVLLVPLAAQQSFAWVLPEVADAQAARQRTSRCRASAPSRGRARSS